MHSTGRPNFWIPPDNAFETATPIATTSSSAGTTTSFSSPGPLEPPTPTRPVLPPGRIGTPIRTAGTIRPPPLPLSPHRGPAQRAAPPLAPAPAPAPPAPVTKPNTRTGQEYSRRERKFESLFNEWTKKMAELEEEHRLVTLRCSNEDESKKAMDDFTRKAQSVFSRYNEEIEALQMSSSEPGSSQSEASEDDDDEEEDEEDEEQVLAGPTPVRSRANQQDGIGEENEDSEEEDDDEGGDDEEDEDEDDADGEGRPSTPMSEPYNIEASSGDDTDHSARKSRRSSKGYQSSEVSNGSLGLNTPPPTEVDEDYRATRRRQAREQRKTDELASALPQRLRSSTVRGTSPASIGGAAPISAASRPPAMSLFETLSSSPASISSMQATSSFIGSRRPSREVSASRPSTIELDPNQPSRIEFLRRQNSTSGSDRSLSRPRQPSPSPSPAVDEHRLFRDQFEGWKTAVRDRSDHWIRKAEQQTEDTKVRFQKEQEEKHKRAQQLFIARQEEMLNHFSRNRAGSTGSGSANMPSPVNSLHPRTGSFAAPSGIGPSASPTMNRHGTMPISASPVTNRTLQNSVSQTFQFASQPSQSPPNQSQQPHSQSPSQAQSRTWVSSNTPLASGRSAKFTQVPSAASSSESEGENGIVEDDESDIAPISYAHNGTPPISIPGSTRGSFDHGHRRTNTAVFTGAPGGSGGAGQSSTPRGNFPQHLRNSSSTTFSSSGTASTRSSGGWSGVSGTSSNTTVISSDTPGSRRGSVGDKSFVQPIGLHEHTNARKPSLPLPATLSASPPKPQPRWTSMEGGASTTNSPASTLSRGSTNGIQSRTTAQQWQTILSSSPSAPPVVTTANSSGPNASSSSSTPSASTARPIPSSINLGQSPGKNPWKAVGQPSPPIPIGTRPANASGSPLLPHFGRFDPSTGLSSSPGLSTSFTTPKPSPPLRSSISNTDLFSLSGIGSTSGSSGLRSRSSVATFMKPSAKVLEEEFENPSRSASPSKGLVPSKASPSPPVVTPTSTQTKDEQPSVRIGDPPPSKRELKRKAKLRDRDKDKDKDKDKEREEEERKKKEAEVEEDRKRKEAEEEERKKKEQEELEEEERRKQEEEETRKQEEETRRQEEEIRRREEEIRLREEEMKKREEESRRRKEEERKRREEVERKKKEEEVKKREEALARKEAELKKREEEYERKKKEEELRRREEQLRKRMEELKRREEELSRRQEEENQREQEEQEKQESAPVSPVEAPQPSPSQSQPPAQSLRRKGDKKQRKRVNDEQKEKEKEAEVERQREEDERRLKKEQEESDRLEAERLAAEEEVEAVKEAERLDQERLEAEEERARELRKEALRLQEQAALEEARLRQEQKILARAREEEQRQAQLRREDEQRRQAQARREEEQRQTRSRQQDEQRRQAQLRQEEERRQRNAPQTEDRQSEEERRTAERIRQENDRLTEMYQARERTQQMSSNMPRRMAEAWEAYDDRWRRLIQQAQAGPAASGHPTLTFSTVPWPTLNPPSGPDAITRNVVGAFILSQWHSQGKTRRDRIRDALRQWHPDRFESRYLVLVPEGTERENVKSGINNVARSLNELLTAEGSTGHL